ncbi:ABC-type uncharacterized transport system, periplasmic component [Desulfosarcina cetonica]|nr:ABC-type uncharacterized transport system, periplasmic component [Desulfosarcina cetonica]
MQKIIARTIIPLLFLCFFSVPTFAADTKYNTEPIHSVSPSKKWRIGYLQGGDYIDYKRTLLATVKGLADLGWMPAIDTDMLETLSVQEIWTWLAHHANSDYIDFVGDGFYCENWDSARRTSIVKDIIERLQRSGDIDLIMAMGTWAGQDLSTAPVDTPVIVMTASDPLAAGIIQSVTESGRKNLHVYIDPTLIERQLRLFHEIIRFKKLGLIYEDTAAGRSYAGVAIAEKLSSELGFNIVSCIALSDIPDIGQSEQEYLQCIHNISLNIDAFFTTVHSGVNEKTIPMIAEQLNRLRTPTFSQSGAEEVEKGILMSLSRNTFKGLGKFEAMTIAKVFNGANPGDLVQVFEEPLSISLNLETAKSIGYIPSADIIAATDIFFP